MIGNIIEIKENDVIVKLSINVLSFDNLINNYILFQDKRQIIGEVINISNNNLYISLVGEIVNGNFIYGITTKPSFKSQVYLIDKKQIGFIIGSPEQARKTLYLGQSPIYEDVKINIDINKFFSSHFAILGGTGSGKSWGVARIIQNIYDKNNLPYNSNLVIFDTYGEYQRSFEGIEENNPSIGVKTYTTNLETNDEILRIPPYLLDVDDLAILLNATTPNQLLILEKALKLVNIFCREEVEVIKIKNDIIARAVLDILLSGRPSVQIRDQVFSVLAFYKTEELNLDTVIHQPGYNRALKHCLLIDADGKLREIELLTDFFSSYLITDLDDNLPSKEIVYTLKDLESAIDFALISEGILKSEKVYDENNLLKVRIHNLVNGNYSTYFNYDYYLTKENYISELINKEGKKVQIINFNINYVDDRFAKTIVKIISKMLFDVVKLIKPRASIPFHIIVEEAHRYIQSGEDVDLLGYNIFERISKEGRKYGILLGLISQRPSELSETSLSQCNNFLVFKMVHPKDMEYIRKLIPFMTDEVSKRLQVIQPGFCYCFGSAFKVPAIVKLDTPNPPPESNNVDISNTWYIKE